MSMVRTWSLSVKRAIWRKRASMPSVDQTSTASGSAKWPLRFLLVPTMRVASSEMALTDMDDSMETAGEALPVAMSNRCNTNTGLGKGTSDTATTQPAAGAAKTPAGLAGTTLLTSLGLPERAIGRDAKVLGP